MPKCSTWVVKLGGSLIGTPALPRWLDAIAEAGSGHRIIVVPGGGLFSDAVREAQNRLQFDDAVAHRMAMQGMRQFGWALNALMGALSASGLTGLADILAGDSDRGVWIWDPCDPRLVGSDLPEDWRVTSDSLSLWLCGEIEDSSLLLVKSRTPTGDASDVRGLAGESFVDEYFPVLWRDIDRPAWWLTADQSTALESLLAGRPMHDHAIAGNRRSGNRSEVSSQ